MFDNLKETSECKYSCSKINARDIYGRNTKYNNFKVISGKIRNKNKKNQAQKQAISAQAHNNYD